MGAASYIGRIGGLAMALGVGAAIITGHGVAYATPDGGSQSGGSQHGGSQNGGSQDGGPQTGGSQHGNQTGTTGSTTNKTGEPTDVKVKSSQPSAPTGRHRATGKTPDSVTATTIVRRLSDAAEEAAKRVANAIQTAADATNGDKTLPAGTPRSGELSSRTERVAERKSSPDTSVADGATDTDRVVANEALDEAPATQTSLWTPPRFPTGPGRLLTMKAAPATTTVSTALRAPNVLAAALGDASNPFAANAPTTPTQDSPLSWMLLGAARRQIGVDAITYDPDITLVNGVITGVNDGPMKINGNPLTYTVISGPSGGGKVLFDPANGSFSFLPDLASVQHKTSEDFSVLVAEKTPFNAALQRIPLIGDFVPQVLVALHQVPVVNVVLAPLIGRSTVVDLSVDVECLAYNPDGTRKPIAFTAKVPSPVDGALISTNYFPATTVVNGAASAPTILNGPGLTVAANTDPESVSIDGLVPGLKPLRDAGYNVVTWDPRGQFASGGILQLDSPAFEGQDVRGIINWLSDNHAYTSPAFDNDTLTDSNTADAAYADTDPAIGMVGGSYGGTIQLVTAGIDPRVDVIVPGVAWNSLNDSLYPRGVFKTSYSAVLLLGLVTTGARINPQIYGGILTGALLGILTPDQRALLAASGPDFLTDNIDIPTLFIQGTADVLFPLQQALNNAATLGTPAEDITMIWFCGGHGVCQTMNRTQIAEQTQMLLNATLDELDSVLMNQPDTLPKFQFVDQHGQWYTATRIPTDDAFYSGSTPVTTNDEGGGALAIVPLIDGSGPGPGVPLPFSLGLGAEARNAINIPLEDAPDGTTIVGAPHLTFNYSGIGTSRSVYAQIVDKNTGLVVGNLVTPIPVTLDGRPHRVDVSMENIVYTYGDDVPTGADLELQIVGSATPYLNLTQFGFINVSDVSVSLPTPGPDANVLEEGVTPVAPVMV
jgi:ABC-2 type transport system ATP-binding protein